MVDYSKQYNTLKPLLPTLVNITEEIEKATKEGRTLGKEAFVPFGYGSSTATVKENIGVKLAYAVLNRIVDTNDTEMMKAFTTGFDMTDDEYNEFVKSIENEYVEVEQPLMSGMMTMEKLYHMPKYSNKVTTDIVTGKQIGRAHV